MNDKYWEFIDLSDFVERNEEFEGMSVDSYFSPRTSDLEGKYVLDMDYAEIMNIDYDDLIRDK